MVNMAPTRPTRALLASLLALLFAGAGAGTVHAIPPDPPDRPDPPADPAPPPPTSGYPSPATASVGTTVGGCYVSAYASWNRNTNVLTLSYYVSNPYLFAACRTRVTARYDYTYRPDDGTASFRHSYDLPTACGVWDSCPSDVSGTMTIPNALEPVVFPAIGKWIRPFTITASLR
jgi:hypothetical protein